MLGRLRDDHAAGFRFPLQPRRKIGCGSECSEFRLVGRTGLQHIPDHRFAGGYSNPDLGNCTTGRIQTVNGLDYTQACPHSPLRIVFTGLRITEIRKNAVTKVLGDEAVYGLDLGHHRISKTGQQVPVIFHVHLFGERYRTDEVTEHHRQLPSFGLADCWLG